MFQSLAAELDAITAAVKRQAPAEIFSAMEAANAALAATGIAEKALRKGDRMPDFALPDATGQTLRSADLLARGPLVLAFYRGQWCPYCNLELKALQARLGDIAAKGATLVAVSPQKPDQSLSTQQKHALAFPVLSDANNALARAFGLVFAVSESLRPIYTNFGIDLVAHNGVETWELPVPATYVVGKDGVIVEAFINADYRKRLEPETVLAWLDGAM